MLGLLIGAVSGTLQFFLLAKFTGLLTGGKVGGKTLIFALTQFLLPFSVLLICAFFLHESLMFVGIGMAAALITCAVVRFIMVSRTKKK